MQCIPLCASLVAPIHRKRYPRQVDSGTNGPYLSKVAQLDSGTYGSHFFFSAIKRVRHCRRCSYVCDHNPAYIFLLPEETKGARKVLPVYLVIEGGVYQSRNAPAPIRRLRDSAAVSSPGICGRHLCSHGGNNINRPGKARSRTWFTRCEKVSKAENLQLVVNVAFNLRWWLVQ